MQIFRKVNDYDFERVEIDVIATREKSVLIRHNNGTNLLEWDSQYTFSDLKVDDVLNIYILGEDYTQGFVLPQIRNLNIKDQNITQLFQSALDKIKKSNEAQYEAIVGMVVSLANFYYGKNAEDFNLLKGILDKTEVGDDNFNKLKELIDRAKSK